MQRRQSRPKVENMGLSRERDWLDFVQVLRTHTSRGPSSLVPRFVKPCGSSSRMETSRRKKTPFNGSIRLGRLAERAGFEPAVRCDTYDDLANRCFRPLSHLSGRVSGNSAHLKTEIKKENRHISHSGSSSAKRLLLNNSKSMTNRTARSDSRARILPRALARLYYWIPL